MQLLRDRKLAMKAKRFCRRQANICSVPFKCTILLILLLAPALSEEFLLMPQQSLMLGNRTLLVEDADSQAGLVWLSVLEEKKSPQSMVVAAGTAFRCGEVTISIDRIYAGDGLDLVALSINATSRSLQEKK
jgi:hypothetical protein